MPIDDGAADGTTGPGKGTPGHRPRGGKISRGQQRRAHKVAVKARRQRVRRRDRRQIHQLRNMVTGTKKRNPFNEVFAPAVGAKADRVAHAIVRSQRKGTFNHKDKRAAKKVIQQLSRRIDAKATKEPQDNELRGARRSLRVATNKGRIAGSPLRGDSDRVKGPDHDNPGTRLHKRPRNKGGSGGGKNHPPRPRKGGGGKGGKGHNRNRVRPGVNYTGTPGYRFNMRDSRQRAANLVDADIRSQLNPILDDARHAKSEYRQAIERIKNEGQRRRDDVNYVFGETSDYYKNLDKQQRDRFQQQKGTLNDLYNNLIQTNNQQAESGHDQMMSELQRLGISGAHTGQFEQDAQFLQGQANTNKANAFANFTSERDAAQSVMDMMQGAVKGERQSQIGQAWNDTGDQLADTRQDYADLFRDLRGDIRDVRSQRGQMMQELMMTLEDQGYQRFAEQQQQNFLNQMMANEFNLDMDKFNFDVAQFRSDKRQQKARQKSRLRRQRTKQRGLRNQRIIGNEINDVFGNIPFL